MRDTFESLRESPWFSLGVLSYDINSPIQQKAHDVLEAALRERDELRRIHAGDV